MGEEKQKPLTREDVLDAIARNGGSAWDLDLSGERFEGAINLRDLNLAGIILSNAVLLHVKFDGSNLKRAKLREANLQHATFNKHDDKITNLSEADLSGASLEDAEFRDANLEGAQFGDKEEPDMITPLFDTDFRGANLRFTDFIACSFFRTKLAGTYLFKANIYDSDLEDADWGDYVIGEEKKKHFYSADSIYRRLKVWYNNAGYSDTAAKFYYREKEVNRKALKWLSKSSFCHRLALELSYLVFGHGERWRRVPLSMAVLLLLFAAAYYFGGNLEPLDSLYYSAVSFTALGYGKWALEPIGWVKGLGAFEAFVGVFMMALLLVTFVRKWTR